MNLQELRRLVNSEYRKAINEAGFRHELPPEAHAEYDRVVDSRYASAVEELKDYALENFENWAHEEVDEEIAKKFVEDYIQTDQVDFQDAEYVLEPVLDELQSDFDEHYIEEEGARLTLDGVYEWVTRLMDDSDY